MTVDQLIQDIVTANKILAAEGICDAFGHVSGRHPDRPDRFFLSRAKAPELIEAEDIMEFTLEGDPVEPGRKPYLERFIHGSIYEARPDVQAVVHSHSRSVLPFGVTNEKLRPIVHSCATIGHDIPVWDAQDGFGDTELLVSSVAMGRDLARVLGAGSSALMRGHGSTVAGRSVREAVYTAYYLEVNAKLQMDASRFGSIKFLTDGEVTKIKARLADAKPGEGYDRAWAYWARRAAA
jgi:HCOMODA/2-hydroxy-3-carboxy-muconic semialdehyde decarboxylase